MKKIITFLLLFNPGLLHGQQTQGIIFPKTTFSNQTPDTLVYYPKNKLEILMDQEQLNKDLITAFETRIEICDSALQLKSEEAENWYNKLLETDTQLKNVEIEKTRKERWNKLKTRLWFGTGVVLGVLVCVLL